MTSLETSDSPDTAPLTTGRRRRGPTKGDLKEAAILDTAWRLLAEKPMASITIDELAAGAGISRSSFYFYFTSRDEVIRALARRITGELNEAVLAPMRTDRPVREVITAVITNLLARWRIHGPVLRAMDSLSEDDSELWAFWASISGSAVAEFASAIDRERALGRAPEGPPSSVDLVWGLTHLYWRAGRQLSLGAGSSDEAALVETLTIMTIRTIYSDLR
jgi:TetR/AcrR family transcriptional regulator, ethionamide resistance regulator